MNKKAVVEDWGDVMWTFLVVVVVLFVFYFFTGSENTKIEKALENVDNQLERETALMNYLRTPVATEDFTDRSGWFSGNSDKLKAFTTQFSNSDLTIADLFRLIETDKDYISLIGLITSNDDYFSKQKIDVSSEFGSKQLTSVYYCTGKSSIAYIPSRSQKPITVTMVMCS